MAIKEIRQKYGLSQLEASKIVGIPLRTFVRYESDDNYGDKLKRQQCSNLSEASQKDGYKIAVRKKYNRKAM